MQEMAWIKDYLIIVCVVKKMLRHTVRQIFYDWMRASFENSLLERYIEWFCTFRNLDENDIILLHSLSSSEREFH
jgi:hypothetical protein